MGAFEANGTHLEFKRLVLSVSKMKVGGQLMCSKGYHICYDKVVREHFFDLGSGLKD